MEPFEFFWKANKVILFELPLKNNIGHWHDIIVCLSRWKFESMFRNLIDDWTRRRGLRSHCHLP